MDFNYFSNYKNEKKLLMLIFSKAFHIKCLRHFHKNDRSKNIINFATDF